MPLIPTFASSSLFISFLFVFYAASLFPSIFANLDQMSVVVMAPHNSSTKSHFNLSSRFAVVLAKQKFVKKIHIVIPVYAHEKGQGHWPSEAKLNKLRLNDKITLEQYTIEYERIQELPNYKMDTRAGCQAEEKAKERENWGDVKAEEGEEDRIEEIVPPGEEKQMGKIPKKWPMVNPQMSKYTIYENEQLIFEVMAKDEHFIKSLSAEHFDVGMAEHFHMGAFALFPLIGAKASVISRISTLNGVWLDYAGVMDKAIKLKLPERKALWLHGDAAMSENRNYKKDYEAAVGTNNELIRMADSAFDEIYKKYKKEFVGIRQLFQQTDYQFANWQLGMDFPQLEILHKEMPKLVYVGGICMPNQLGEPDKKTAEWFADYRQIVPVSFGSILETEEMPVEYFEKFMQTFGKFDDNFLFIWNFKFGPNGKDRKHKVKVPQNVRLVEWMQLPLILTSHKTRLFISHCGGGSAGEAIAAGVPLICIPFSAGQPYNARSMQSRGLAKVIVDIGQIVVDSDLLENSIKEGLKMKGDGEFEKNLEIVQKEMKMAEHNFIKTMENLNKKVTAEKKEAAEQEENKVKSPAHPRRIGHGIE